ncbi:MAG TPA: type ISP restriction/modification enzyme [Longimicrobium sp.]|nr:type ISP restriction/modification enzyme [Longimicrobium sp.]
MQATVPRHIHDYYRTLHTFERQGATSEGAVRMAFYELLTEAGRPLGLTLLAEQPLTLADGRRIRLDGEVRDGFRLPHGVWEAKDVHDDIDCAIARKIDQGYPLKNTLFENTRTAVLYQNGARCFTADVRNPEALQELLDRFFAFSVPQVRQFHAAVERFGREISRLAGRLKEIIDRRTAESAEVRRAMVEFLELCRLSLNPATTLAEVEDMLRQHLLTEKIFTSVFRNRDFVRRNPIAWELEKISDRLTADAFSRDDFLAPLEPFYAAVEAAARTIADYTEKQHFLHTVYERFFQRFSTAAADTHGIVYTPLPIVEWIVRSVEHVLRERFGESLSDPGVHVLDPCVGTGTFMLSVLDAIAPSAVPRKYATELHCNEVLLLPYYVAAQNIEHEFFERTQRYAPFEGICFADTLGARETQGGLFAPENADRLHRQEAVRMRVILGNPPYNVGQQREGDGNRNRAYPELDARVRATYGAASRATNRKALRDMYVRFIRWASDRLDDRGVVAFVCNSSFLDHHAFDGMRRALREDFTQVFVLDLGGNVRKNPKLSGSKHNVFGIQVGVAIVVLVRDPASAAPGAPAEVWHAALAEEWTRRDKLQHLTERADLSAIDWTRLEPDARETWLTAGTRGEFGSLLPLGSRDAKLGRGAEVTVFHHYSLGVVTNRDWWVYDFADEPLARRMEALAAEYNAEVDRWMRAGRPPEVDAFVLKDERRIKWSRDLKRDLRRLRYASFDPARIRTATYRPFVEKRYYFDPLFSQDIFRQPRFFPDGAENVAICVTDVGAEKPFGCLAVTHVPDLHLVGAGAGTQCFPFHVFTAQGERRENVTDAALAEFRSRYGNVVTKWDVFDYVYGVLHSPEYRARYAADLRRELPRLPYVNAEAFFGFVAAGRRLRALHTGGGAVRPCPLERVERDPFTWRVEKMRLSRDRTELVVNDTLTLRGIPREAFAYEVAGRPALQWVVDHVGMRRDGVSGIAHDPNDPEHPERIVALVERVVGISVESAGIVAALPGMDSAFRDGPGQWLPT